VLDRPPARLRARLFDHPFAVVAQDFDVVADLAQSFIERLRQPAGADLSRHGGEQDVLAQDMIQRLDEPGVHQHRQVLPALCGVPVAWLTSRHSLVPSRSPGRRRSDGAPPAELPGPDCLAIQTVSSNLNSEQLQIGTGESERVSLYQNVELFLPAAWFLLGVRFWHGVRFFFAGESHLTTRGTLV